MSASILVIDDDPSILDVLTEVLNDEGYTVRVASNGAEGLQAIGQAEPALVLLDMRMPVLDGWGFTQRLRDQGIDIPIIVMTAAQDARRWAHEVGATGYVAKPFNLSQLLDAIGRVV